MMNGRKKEDSLLNRSGNVFKKFLGSKPGGVLDMDESQLEEKIAKIRAMAREARQSEGKVLGANDLVSSSDVVWDGGDEFADGAANSVFKTGIEKEVDERLIKLQKRLCFLQEKSLMPSVSYLSNSGESTDMKNSKISNNTEKAETLVLSNSPESRYMKNSNAQGKAEISVLSNSPESRDMKILKISNSKGKAETSVLSNSPESRDMENSKISNAKGKAETLVFKKKHKFRSYTTNNGSSPKGFQGLKDHSMSKENDRKNGNKDLSIWSRSTSDSGMNVSVGEQGLDLPDCASRENMVEEDFYRLKDKDLDKYLSEVSRNEVGKNSLRKELNSFQAIRRKSNKEVKNLKRGMATGVKHTEPKTGGIPAGSHERPLTDSVEPRESSELKTQVSRSFRKEDMDTSAISSKQAALSSNGSSRLLLQNREVGKKPIVNQSRNEKSEIKNDLWWLNLPYALVILLRRGSDPNGPRGLYTFKINSHSQDESCISYTVAFEDRSDAVNFCYLLESFFKDLGDVTADIVPLSIRELVEAGKSSTVKLIVVRKGQLQVYTGQPLANVEMALRSFVE